MLESFRLYNWRNLINSNLFLGEKTVFLVGNNGQGKSNLLEAIYYLNYQSSWRPFDFKTIMTLDRQEGFSLKGLFKGEGESYSTLGIKVEKNQKILTKNDHFIRDRKDFLDVQAPLVFSPSDLSILQGPPSFRRNFLDQTLTLLEENFLPLWRDYGRVLSQKNILLKNKKDKELVAFNVIFSQKALEITKRRKKLIDHFSSFLPFYTERMLSNLFYNLVLSYDSPLLNYASSEELEVFLNSRKEKELQHGFSLYGPHRDKFSIKKDNIDISYLASQGQLRALVLVLKLLQAKIVSQFSNRLPTLLLDDILLEMDLEKREKFFSLLPEYKQAFFTFLPDEPYYLYKKKNTLIYKVKEGSFERIKNESYL